MEERVDLTHLADKLRTIVAIPVTPFDDSGGLDIDSYIRLIGRLIAGGITAVTPNGNTSEFYALSRDEWEGLTRGCIDVTAGRVLVIPGIGFDVTSAIDMARYAARHGAPAVMVHQPVHPYRSSSGWITYHRAIADALPDLAFVPYIRDASVTGEMIDELARRCVNVIGVKYGVPNPVQFATAVHKVERDRLTWVCGLAESWAPFFWIAGARGFTSGLVNVEQSQPLRMLHCLEAGDYDGAMRVWSKIKPFEDLRARHDNANNVSVVKEALCQMGLCRRSVRPPVTELVEAERQEVGMMLDAWTPVAAATE